MVGLIVLRAKGLKHELIRDQRPGWLEARRHERLGAHSVECIQMPTRRHVRALGRCRAHWLLRGDSRPGFISRSRVPLNARSSRSCSASTPAINLPAPITA